MIHYIYIFFRLQNIVGLYHNIQCNILMLEYRGYGLSQGTPSEEGLYMDARAGIDYLFSRTDINTNEIIVFGRSLGKEFYYLEFLFIFQILLKFRCHIKSLRAVNFRDLNHWYL